MKKIFICVMSLCLGGCFFSTKDSNFYLLEAQNPTEVLLIKTSIAVQDIGLPDYLQKPQIVLQKNDSPELKISEFNRWASDLGEMLQNALIENLQALAPKTTVKPLAYGVKTKFVVKINIEKMSGYFHEKAVLKGAYSILSSSGRVLKQADFAFETQSGKNYADYVNAQSKLVADLASLIMSVLPIS